MSRKRLKFVAGIAIVLGVVAWEAITGFQQSKTYYVTVDELLSGKAPARQHIRLGGVVEPNSIERHGGTVTFRLAQDARAVPVTYVGSDTLPDTFTGGSQAIVDGDFSNGVFRAEKIQAKCTSKYQAAPPGVPPANHGNKVAMK